MLRRTFLAAFASPVSSAAVAAPPVIERAWFGPTDRRHGHDALGLGTYPGRIHAQVRDGGRSVTLQMELAQGAAFEDALVRILPLGRAAAPEIMVVIASRDAGAAVAVLGVERQAEGVVLRERARSPAVGAGRWLNPIGAADFDGDGQREVVSVSTPHIGGVLTLYRYQPPALLVVAQEGNVSNHVYGERQQQLAALIHRRGRLVVAVPDQRRRRLRFLAPTSSASSWESVAPDEAFDQPIDSVRILPGELLQVHAGASPVRLLDTSR